MLKNRILKLNSTLFSILLISVLIPSCVTVGPDYSPPEINTPDEWQTEYSGNISAEPDKDANAEWWKSFNDPVLSDLITRALSNNLSIMEARARLTESRLRNNISEADRYPSLSSSASATKSRSSGRSSKFYKIGFDSSWEIDLFGGISRSIEASGADVDSADESLNDVMISLTAEVALNYIELRLYQSQLNVTETNLKSQEDTYEIVSWRYQAGLVTELDLDKAESNLEQTRSQVPGLYSKIDQARNRIAVLVGNSPGSLDRELSPVRTMPELNGKIDPGIPADLLRRRPDLRKAERDLAAQTARIGVAVSDLYPKITLSGSIGIESSTTGSLFDSDSLSRSIGPSISWPVFRAGAIRRNVEVQTLIAEQRLVQYKSLVLTALEEVENALSSCANEHLKRESLKKAAAAAKRSLELSRVQYSSGLVDFQVLLESERTLLSLQDQLSQSDGQIAVNYITLYKALGGGWPHS